ARQGVRAFGRLASEEVPPVPIDGARLHRGPEGRERRGVVGSGRALIDPSSRPYPSPVLDPATIARARMRAQCLWSSDFKDPQKALTHLVAVQAQEFAYARWSLAQRSGDPASSVVQRAFDDGRILRTHILRPTWHFVAPRDLRWLMRLSGARVIAWNARRCRELGLDAKTLAKSNDVIAKAVEEQPLTRRALAAVLDQRKLSPDGQRMPYMLMRAELDMIVTSGPLEGKQHTYASFDSRVPAAREITRDQALGG